MTRILAINPGATSTKIAVYDDSAPIFTQTVHHGDQDLKQFPQVIDQLEYRMELIRQALQTAGVALSSIDGVVGRGGLLKPLPGGTYLVNEAMVTDLRQAKRGEHASNLGGILAASLGAELGFPPILSIRSLLMNWNRWLASPVCLTCLAAVWCMH